jgi:integrase
MRGSITQRGRNTWRIQIRLGGGKRFTETVHCGKKSEAEAKLREKLVQLDKQGQIPQPGKMTVEDLLKAWLDGYVSTNCSHRTYLGYESIIRTHLLPAFSGVKLKEITPLMIQKYYGKAVQRLSRRSVHSHHVVLSSALKYATRQELLMRNPCTLVDPPSFQKKQMRTLTPEEVVRLIETSKDSYYFPIIYTAVSTGLRQSELLGARWRDLDLDYLSISVNQTLYKRAGRTEFILPKTAHSRRSVKMTTKVSLFLRDYKAERESIYISLLGKILQPDDLVFTSINFQPLNASVLGHDFRKMTSKAKLKNVRFHDLRHTYASLMLKARVSPKEISEALGHASVAFTMDTYAHIIQGMQEDAAAKLNEILPAANAIKGTNGVL